MSHISATLPFFSAQEITLIFYLPLFFVLFVYIPPPVCEAAVSVNEPPAGPMQVSHQPSPQTLPQHFVERGLPSLLEPGSASYHRSVIK